MFDEIDNIPIPVIPSRHPNKNTYHNVHHSYHHHHHHYHRPINLVCKTSPTQGHIRHRQGSKDRTPCHISRRYHHHHHSNHYQRPLMGVTQGDNHLTVDHTRRGHRRQTMDHIANSQPSNGECHSEHQHLVSHNYCNHHDDNNIDLHGTPLSQNEDEKDQIEHRKIDQNGTHRHFNDGNGHECEKLDNKTIHNHRHFNNGNSHEHGELGDKTTRKHRHFNNGNSHGKLGDKTTRKHRHFNNGNIQDRQHRIGRHGQQNTTYVHHRFHDNSHQSWPDSQVSPSSYNNGQGDISNNIKDYNIIKDRKRHLDQGRHVETSQNDSHVQIPNKMSSFFVLYTFLTMAYSLSYRYMKTGLFSWPIYFILFSSLITLSPASSTSSPSSKLHINLVVAQSCDETFLQSLTSKVNTAVENFIQKESPSDEFKLTFGVFPQCDSSSVLAHLSDIFGNDTTNTVVALASYDIHASFIPLADIFQKAYIVCNNHVSNPGMTAPTFAPFPSFAQEALMLAKILDMYRWQNVYVMYTDFRYWLDFSTTLYYTLTSQQFNVTLAKVDTSVDGEATRILQNVGSRKVIVLLMDVSDQEKVLAAASSLSMTTKHAIFVFTDSPYDITSRSLVGLSKEDASLSQFSNDINRPDVSIFESVFVIGPSFPSQNSSQEKSANTRRKRHAVETQLTFHSEKAAADPSNTQFSNFLQTNDDIVVNNNEYKNDLSRQRNINNLSKNNISYENKSTKKEIENISTNDASTLTRFGQLMLKQNIKDEHGNAPGHSTVPEKHSENHKRRKDRDDAQKPSQNTKFLQFRSESQTGKHINDDDNGDYLPNRGDNDYFIDKANDYFFNVDKNADDDQQPLGDGDEIIEYRSKREIHDFKTVESDLDAVYDIVYLLALAAYDNYRGDQTRSFDSRYLISKLANISFTGATGRFGVGPDLQVNFDFAVYDFNTSSERFEPRIFWEAAAPSDWTLAQRQRITWPGRVVLPGDDCFKRVSGCDEGGFETAYILTIVIATIAVVFIVVFIVSLLKRYLTNKEMNKGPNKILMSAADLVFIYKKDVGKSSRTMMKSRGTLTEKENTPDIIRASDPASRSMPSLNDLNDFTQTARYNGDLVHVKELDIEGFEMKSKLLTYIRMLRDLRHENLNPYVGFMVERENKPALVMEYCSRGSLHDMVHNDDIKLDWDFKLSLLTDLVRGMRYLHSSPLKFHGHLTSHNCVIDSRFVLKITTYGVSGIMERCKTARTMEAKDCLWSAPELLRDPVFMQKGSDKGDTYAMAIIFQEVTLRSEPYSTTGLTPEEIVRKLKKPPPLIRPSVTPQAAPPQFIQIMKQCWAEMPEMRPSLDEVYDQFKKLTGGKKANIVDSMFKMLEKYSNDLEDIVAERTMQLEEEKKKTDQLLFRMLPSTVAEALKLGQTVPAETFSEVSIYFSDIVGFTTISAMSTPMQVVDLLNDLYTMFDATIDNYDVYKVETIGDAYMVASGLPIRNGNRHAGEISTMALMLLSQCGEFTIRHMPHVPLRLRIGLHTGSCVAGVVGLTMPRFCLFGDTVNTASRMESTGAAFRIHISEACKGVLDVLGGYNLVFRGKTELKGKGKQNTYWLVGKDGLDKELPEPPPLVGGDNHGLESLLRHMESDAASQKPVGTVSPTKSTSAPDLASPATSPLPPSNSNNTLLPVPDNLLTSSSISQPAHLDNLETLHKDTCKLSDQNQISVVKADVHGGGLGCGQNDLVGGVINFNTDKSPGNDEGLEVDTDNRLVDETMDASMVGIETVKNEYNNHHSESNDSGFGSERKHSQGQEFNAGFQPSSTIPEKVKRNSSLSSMTSSSNRTSVISSSDVTLSHHVTLNCDGHEETLAPVSEV